MAILLMAGFAFVWCTCRRRLTGQFVFNADTRMGYIVHHIHTPPRLPSEIAQGSQA